MLAYSLTKRYLAPLEVTTHAIVRPIVLIFARIWRFMTDVSDEPWSALRWWRQGMRLYLARTLRVGGLGYDLDQLLRARP